jgi:hypothetical protein
MSDEEAAIEVQGKVGRPGEARALAVRSDARADYIPRQIMVAVATPRASLANARSSSLNRRQQSARKFRPSTTGRHRSAAGGPTIRHADAVTLTESGVPAASPNAPPPSSIVFTTEESRLRYPWLPQRVITGSIWRGPAQERVKVDANGDASPWPPQRDRTRP